MRLSYIVSIKHIMAMHSVSAKKGFSLRRGANDDTPSFSLLCLLKYFM